MYLEDSGGAEAVGHAAAGHGAEGRAAHVEVRRLGEAHPAGQESVIVTVTGRPEQALLPVHLIFVLARQYRHC